MEITNGEFPNFIPENWFEWDKSSKLPTPKWLHGHTQNVRIRTLQMCLFGLDGDWEDP